MWGFHLIFYNFANYFQQNHTMSFNSIEFLIFLPLVFLLYWFVFKSTKKQNLLIVVASYVFYGWWDWRFLILIAITTLCSYASGLLIELWKGKRRWQKAVSVCNIVLNISILAVFKYYNFFVNSLNNVFAVLGLTLDWPTANIILPVGISFYTFQALSYSIDVYRQKISPVRDIVAFCAFISFFPQLVAGPIERATRLLPQFVNTRTFDYGKAVDGCRQMLWGFFKKLVIADSIAEIVDGVWAGYSHYTSLNLVLCSILFSFQIYCDFSGYSDIAIGCARLFGINLTRNFNIPYLSRSLPEFWRRWHISLMSWFRDYVYFPLGGSKRGLGRTISNTFVVFFISGLWHGAEWSFVLWGLFHAVFISLYRILPLKSKFEHNVGGNRLLPTFKELAMIAFTFALVTFGWILFRAPNVSLAFDFMSHLCDKSILCFDNLIGKWPLVMCMGLMVVEWIQRDKQHVLQLSGKFFAKRWIRWMLYVSLAMYALLVPCSQQDFIYFQF